ncbi:TraR/DksA family transcriptional regulator [Rhodosalinus sp.]|uniref:TraR/DksA family transcriptional regulator n=1 Tax=Rhodosalinus sp. TaxID=2047741 RepID=UPI0039786788
MMAETDESAVRARLQSTLSELDAGDAPGRGGQDTVALDQQAMGQLSRQDALLSQSMARATQARRDIEQRLRAARARLDAGDYGSCEEIAPKRLALDPTAARCVGCAAG